jgi:hypothetical protein
VPYICCEAIKVIIYIGYRRSLTFCDFTTEHMLQFLLRQECREESPCTAVDHGHHSADMQSDIEIRLCALILNDCGTKVRPNRNEYPMTRVLEQVARQPDCPLHRVELHESPQS